MSENYGKAALRHWRDAELLNKGSRAENADQLYGLAAECALKKVLAFLPAFSSEGLLREQFKVHINVLWPRAHHQSLHNGHPALPGLLKSMAPFDDWDINQRYAADGTISYEVLTRHQTAARRLLGATGLIGVRKR